MMEDILNVVGYRFYEFTPKGSNVTYSGVTLFCVSDDATNDKTNMFGCKVDTVKVADHIPYDPHIGDRIIIRYNRWGKVSDVAYA